MQWNELCAGGYPRVWAAYFSILGINTQTRVLEDREIASLRRESARSSEAINQLIAAAKAVVDG